MSVVILSSAPLRSSGGAFGSGGVGLVSAGVVGLLQVLLVRVWRGFRLALRGYWRTLGDRSGVDSCTCM